MNSSSAKLFLTEWFKLNSPLEIYVRRNLMDEIHSLNHGHIIRYENSSQWKWTVASLNSAFNFGTDFFTGGSDTLDSAFAQANERLLFLGWKFGTKRSRILF
jgi:hypothetical protein